MLKRNANLGGNEIHDVTEGEAPKVGFAFAFAFTFRGVLKVLIQMTDVHTGHFERVICLRTKQ